MLSFPREFAKFEGKIVCVYLQEIRGGVIFRGAFFEDQVFGVIAMRVVSIAGVVLAIWSSSIHVSLAQVPEDENSGGEPPPPPLAITIEGPADPVPIGTKQKLKAVHEEVLMP